MVAENSPDQAQPSSQSGQSKSFLYRLFHAQEVGVFSALVVLIIAMSFLSPFFLKPQNIFNILRGMSTIGIMAIGETMIIITAGIDLSVGAVLAASAMLTARLIFLGVNPWLSVLLGLELTRLLPLWVC
jgi:ribose/xylose/arabinose/galactoside ABC-type transport system permease subunit